jgi:phage tail-like protein
MRRGDWLVGQLPMGMLDDDLFHRFVSLFQAEGNTVLDALDTIPHVVDVSVAPPAVLPWLGSWLGVSWIDPSLDEAVQRRLIRGLGSALAWRGTRRGLVHLLEAVTGGPVQVAESGSVRRHRDAPAPAPWVRIEVASTGWLADEDFVALVADELPVDVAVEILVEGRQLWPRPGVGASSSPGAAAPSASAGAGAEGD